MGVHTKGDAEVFVEEMDKQKRARMYMEKLAEGIDPIADMALPSDSVLNNVRLSRCFTYVASVLGKLIGAGGDEALAQAQNTLPQDEAGNFRASFSVTKEQAASVSVEKEPVEMSVLCKKLNALIDERRMKKLVATKVSDWFVRKGYLQDQYDEDTRKRVRFPTNKGKQLGISSEMHYSYTMKYNATAQRFVLDNIEEITRPREYTWGWGRWQARRASSPWTSGLQSSGRSYAEAAWKESTADEGCVEGGVPETSYTDTIIATKSEANDAACASHNKLWQAAQDVLK